MNKINENDAAKLERLCYNSKKGILISENDSAFVNRMFQDHQADYRIIQSAGAKMATDEVMLATRIT